MSRRFVLPCAHVPGCTPRRLPPFSVAAGRLGQWGHRGRVSCTVGPAPSPHQKGEHLNLSFSQNRHGVIVSDHICDTCDEPFTVTPAVDETRWGGSCLDVTCKSYDPARDADRFFGENPDPGLHRE